MAQQAVEKAIYMLGVDPSDYQRGMAAKVAADDKAIKSGDRMVVSEEKVTKATRNTAETIDRKIARLDPLYAAEQRYNRALEAHARYELEGIGTSAQRLRLLDLERAKLDQTTAALKRQAAAQAEANGLFAGARRGVGMLGLGGALGGSLSVGIVAREVRQVVTDLDDLGDAAERAGVSGAKLQVFRYQLEQGTGSAEDADRALGKFRKTVGELALTGAGPAAEAMKALGIEIRDANGHVRDQEELLDEVLKRFPRIKDEATSAAIAARLFGKEAGAAMEVELRKGAAGFQAAEDHLRSLNGLMSNEALAAADKFDKKFTDLTIRFEASWRRIVVAALTGIDQLNLLDKPEGALGLGASLGRGGSAAMALRQRAERVSKQKDDFIAGPDITLPDLHAEEELEASRKRAKQDLRELLLARKEERQEAVRGIGIKEREAELTPELTTSIHEEAAAREAAAFAAEEQAKAVERAQAMARMGAEFTKSFVSDLRSGLEEGASFWEAFGTAGENALQRITDKLIDMAIDNLWSNAFGGAQGGTGGLGGIFGALFGRGGLNYGGGAAPVGAGLFHNGGMVGSGGAIRYVHPAYFDDAPRMHSGGIAGNEVPAILQRGERVLPVGQSGGGGVIVQNIDQRAKGAPVETETSTDANGRTVIRNIIRDEVTAYANTAKGQSAMNLPNRRAVRR